MPAPNLRRLSPALALTLLAGIGIIGFPDRIIMNVLVEPVKAEFGLSDTEIGLVNGLAFALLNIILGLVVARVAERSRRLTLVAIGTFFWSLATAATGMAQSFVQLLLARIGVGVGEAVGLPATGSVIADYFPPSRRATALSILNLSAPIGALLGALGGSIIAARWGWQYALYAAAVPGLILAVLLHVFLEEPPRGQHDTVVDADAVPPMRAVLMRYWQRRTMRHMLIGNAIASMIGFGLNAFVASWLARRFGFSLVEAGATSGLVASLPAAFSITAAGWLGDRWGRTSKRAYALIPAISMLVATPVYILGVTSGNAFWAVTLIGIAALVQYSYMGTTFAVFHNMLHPRMRATGSAFTGLVYSLVGGGFGPLLMGALSDGLQGIAPTPGHALAWAMAGAATLYLWASLHYFLAARHIEAELALPTDPEPA